MHWNALKYIEIHWKTLKYIEIHWNTLKYIEIHWNTLKYIEIHWDTLKCIEMHWNALKCIEIQYPPFWTQIHIHKPKLRLLGTPPPSVPLHCGTGLGDPSHPNLKRHLYYIRCDQNPHPLWLFQASSSRSRMSLLLIWQLAEVYLFETGGGPVNGPFKQFDSTNSF